MPGKAFGGGGELQYMHIEMNFGWLPNEMSGYGSTLSTVDAGKGMTVFDNALKPKDTAGGDKQFSSLTSLPWTRHVSKGHVEDQELH